ncbi:LytR C-terminal domain-containing protein [Actinomycetospora sp. NBRC 106375]|uniref:LytR C-terminal domain-containing protein n=1 Tax=Actinomycetospora sp. NBRC 106375 TaxID=3032207 RepID=UPI0025532028|nr:LytR C-terminal domain-containing protein [Actinomycetospora sp. NBRC 106375]
MPGTAATPEPGLTFYPPAYNNAFAKANPSPPLLGRAIKNILEANNEPIDEDAPPDEALCFAEPTCLRGVVELFVFADFAVSDQQEGTPESGWHGWTLGQDPQQPGIDLGQFLATPSTGVPCGARPVFYYESDDDFFRSPGVAGSREREERLHDALASVEVSDSTPGLLPAFDRALEQLETERSTVRVYNNSPRTGLADRAADQLREAGWSVGMVGNYNAIEVPESTVYYRPNTGEEGAARALATRFGATASERFPDISNASPGVIVIAAEDWDQNVNRSPARSCSRTRPPSS